MKRLLIIEDDKMLATIYLKKFSMAGISARIAGNGKDGLKLMSSYAPHGLLLDLALPEMSGVEVLKSLRADAATVNLPVIVFTNSFLPQPIKEAQDAGATEVITKADCPITTLITRISAILEKSNYEPPPAVVESVAPVIAVEVDPRQNFRELAQRLQSAVDQLLLVSDNLSRVHEVARAAHAIGGSAVASGEHTLAWMASALEALVQDLLDKPKYRNPSSISTVADAARLLVSWLQGTMPTPSRRPVDCRILAVDDDPIVSQLVTAALARAQLRCATMKDPLAALEMLREDRFDLVILDIEMPNMDGMALCRELRQIPHHKNTPIVFVTAVGEFERRQEAGLSGGNDLLAKPFLPIEVAVKALTWMLRTPSSAPGAT